MHTHVLAANAAKCDDVPSAHRGQASIKLASYLALCEPTSQLNMQVQALQNKDTSRPQSSIAASSLPGCASICAVMTK